MFYTKHKIFGHLNLLDDFYNGKKPAPVTVDIEPENNCNLNCYWCYPKIQGWREKFKGRMSKELLLKLPSFFEEWGSKTLVITGGGEPFLHPNIIEFIEEINKTKLNMAILTNGVLLKPNVFDQISAKKLDWMGFSIDCGTRETFKKVKGVDKFDIMIKNAEYVRKKNKELHFTYKFLITTTNYKDIFVAAKLAKEIGFDCIYFRPAIGLHETFTDEQKDKYNHLLNDSKQLEDSNFEVSYNVEKINDDFKQELEKISECIAVPTLITICADGNSYWCQDHRGEEFWKIGNINNGFNELLNNWGSDEHIKKIRSIVPQKNCNRCSFKSYNEVLIERKNYFINYI